MLLFIIGISFPCFGQLLIRSITDSPCKIPRGQTSAALKSVEQMYPHTYLGSMAWFVALVVWHPTISAEVVATKTLPRVLQSSIDEFFPFVVFDTSFGRVIPRMTTDEKKNQTKRNVLQQKEQSSQIFCAFSSAIYLTTKWDVAELWNSMSKS